jgi:transitional endoplasmic reticulum ATPase
MDGIEELKGVMVLAATNRKDLIDPALLRSGRFDLTFELPQPDENTRKTIFEIHTKNKTLHKSIDLQELALRTTDMTGADIEFICRKASMFAIREFIETQVVTSAKNYSDKCITVMKTHFDKAIEISMNQNGRK